MTLSSIRWSQWQLPQMIRATPRPILDSSLGLALDYSVTGDYFVQKLTVAEDFFTDPNCFNVLTNSNSANFTSA